MPQNTPQIGERRIFDGGQLGEWDGQRWKRVRLTDTMGSEENRGGSEQSAVVDSQTWADQLGLNAPTDSPMRGFVRGASAAAVDLAEGTVSELSNRMRQKHVTERANAEQIISREGQPSRPVRLPNVTHDEWSAPETSAGTIGTWVPTAAELAAPVGVTANTFPRVARAAEKFQQVMAKAEHVPVNVSDMGDVALRILQLSERGGSMPMAVRKLLVRLTDPNKDPMLYRESRDFASNISRLSANDYQRMTPVVAREVAKLSAAVNKANAEAARRVGMVKEYQSAMREYANAMRVRNVINSAIEGAKKSAPYATAVGAGYWLSKKMADLIDR